MSYISARSPYIVEINESGQEASKVELRLWNGAGSAPASPTYTLQKNIPSATNLQTTYNISPFIKEFISHTTPVDATSQGLNLSSSWCNVQIKRYKIISGTATLLNTVTLKAFDGYNIYTEGYNYNQGIIRMAEGTYYYPLGQNSIGSFLVFGSATIYAVYTNLKTGATHTASNLTSAMYNIPCLYPSYYTGGNKLEIMDEGGALKTFYFRPIEECRYTPVMCDFINKYGSWQKTWFFKASNDTLTIENDTYNLLQTNLVNYSIYEGQKKGFNTRAKRSIKVNTGYVSDSYNQVLEELMLSEKILIDDKPVVLNTKNTELFKNINTKLINYSLDFEYAYDYNTTVV